jgi:hypothetical protein
MIDRVTETGSRNTDRYHSWVISFAALHQKHHSYAFVNLPTRRSRMLLAFPNAAGRPVSFRSHVVGSP